MYDQSVVSNEEEADSSNLEKAAEENMNTVKTAHAASSSALPLLQEAIPPHGTLWSEVPQCPPISEGRNLLIL